MSVKLPDNPFPEPYTVPNCVDDQPYPDKIRFIKRTLVGHLVTIFLIAFSAQALTIPLTDPQLLVLLGILLFLMTIVRVTLKSGRLEQFLSLVALAAAIPLLGQLCKDIHNAGYPIISLLIAAALAGLYTLLAGRDFNFSGMVAICSLTLIPILITLRYQQVEAISSIPFAWLISTVYLAYVAYNLSMILKRRQPSEVPTAVADFYRDALNFLTYPVRVYFHWRNYQFQ